MRSSLSVPSLRPLRALGGLSQQALAKKAGLSTATVGRLERGTEQAWPSTLVALADALSCDPDALLKPDSAEHTHRTQTLVLDLTALLQESLVREQQIRNLLTTLGQPQ